MNKLETNEDLIRWAQLDGKPELREQFDRLIWISKNRARMEVWRGLQSQAKQESDVCLIESYPGGFRKRKLKEFDFSGIEKLPTDEDYMAAMGPCGK